MDTQPLLGPTLTDQQNMQTILEKTTPHSTYVPHVDPRYRWHGDGPPPCKWFAADGTLVYRSYADYCMD